MDEGVGVEVGTDGGIGIAEVGFTLVPCPRQVWFGQSDRRIRLHSKAKRCWVLRPCSRGLSAKCREPAASTGRVASKRPQSPFSRLIHYLLLDIKRHSVGGPLRSVCRNRTQDHFTCERWLNLVPTIAWYHTSVNVAPTPLASPTPSPWYRLTNAYTGPTELNLLGFICVLSHCGASADEPAHNSRQTKFKA